MGCKLHPCSNLSHMSARRRNALDTTITVRLTRPLAAKLKAEAKRRRVSVGALVRLYIEHGLEMGSLVNARRMMQNRLMAELGKKERARLMKLKRLMA